MSIPTAERTKVTITMTDSDDGKVDVNITFDPPVDTSDDPEYSPAQTRALLLLQAFMTEESP